MKAEKKKWNIHKGSRHHLLVPSQYMGGEPRSWYSEGVV